MKNASPKGGFREILSVIVSVCSIVMALGYGIIIFTDTGLLFEPVLILIFSAVLLVDFVLVLMERRLELGLVFRVLLKAGLALGALAVFLAVFSFLLVLFLS